LKIDGPIVMYVGNFEKYQGIDLLLEGIQHVLAKKLRIHLVLIGGSELDIELYKKKSGTLGINKHTHFLGPRSVDQLAFFLKQADILVSPRIKGGNTPMKIYSYIDSGKPVIATNLPTHTQVLDKNIAVLVEPDPKAMARGLISLIKNAEYARNLARSARERAKKDFSFESFQKKLLDFYSFVEDKIGLFNSQSLNGKVFKA